MKNLSEAMQVQQLKRAVLWIEEAVELLDNLSEQTTGSRSQTYEDFARDLVNVLSIDNNEAGLAVFLKRLVSEAPTPPCRFIGCRKPRYGQDVFCDDHVLKPFVPKQKNQRLYH